MVRAIVNPGTTSHDKKIEHRGNTFAETVSAAKNLPLCGRFSETERPRSRTEPAWGCQT